MTDGATRLNTKRDTGRHVRFNQRSNIVWILATVGGLTAFGTSSAVGIIALGAVFGMTTTVVLIALIGSPTLSSRAFRLMRLLMNRAEPPARATKPNVTAPRLRHMSRTQGDVARGH